LYRTSQNEYGDKLQSRGKFQYLTAVPILRMP
jgi:hypothetical protein